MNKEIHHFLITPFWVDLFKSTRSPFVKVLTKLRYYIITTIISQQDKKIGRTVRYLASDCALWKSTIFDGFMELMKEISVKADKDYILTLYNPLHSKKDFVEFHFHSDIYKVDDVN